MSQQLLTFKLFNLVMPRYRCLYFFIAKYIRVFFWITIKQLRRYKILFFTVKIRQNYHLTNLIRRHILLQNKSLHFMTIKEHHCAFFQRAESNHFFTFFSMVATFSGSDRIMASNSENLPGRKNILLTPNL